jgi:hypothetical protein
MPRGRFLIVVALIVLIPLVQQFVHGCVCMCEMCFYGRWSGVEWEVRAALYGDAIAATPGTIFIELGMPGNPPCWEVPY